MEMLDKYNVAVPRYTSYPPANYFESMPQSRYLDAIDQSNSSGDSNISLYFHFPFCRHLCFYCGCNSLIMPKEGVIEDYIKALHSEIDMIIPRLDKGRKISQIHFGGGSPTVMSVDELKRIIDRFKGEFEFTPDAEVAIECHPAYLDSEYWRNLSRAGFNRVSIGVQDFDEKVLKGVNRKSSMMKIENIFDILRSEELFINLDFIYGLPHQSVQSFAETIKRAVELKPDRVVTFSYAHVPWVNPKQKWLEKEGLPPIQEKVDMYDISKEILTGSGYMALGLDHFVKPHDQLAIAYKNAMLHRNFQGYCTRQTTGQVYAFGVSAISQLSGAYFQNIKDVDTYIDLMNKRSFAYDKGYILSDDQRVVSDLIAQLMCNGQVMWSNVAERFGISVEKLFSIIDYNEDLVSEFCGDGIVKLCDAGIKITDIGAKYIRNVAASFDPLMKENKKSFSKSL